MQQFFGSFFGGGSILGDNQDDEHESGISRLGSSMCFACLSPFFFIGALILLGYNEKRSVCEARALNVGYEDAREVGCTDSSEGSGELVIFSCDLQTPATPLTVTTGEFNGYVTHYGICLNTTAEMVQCHETVQSQTTKDSFGGGKTTVKTYTYSTKWSSRYVDDNEFNKLNSVNWYHMCGTRNPNSLWHGILPSNGAQFVPSAKAGAWTIPKSGFLDRMSCSYPVSADSNPPGWVSSGSYYTKSSASSNMGIGNMRVSFSSNNPNEPKVTVLGKNSGGKVGSWTAPSSWFCSGDTLSDLREGTLSKEELFKIKKDASAAVTWILRLVGFILAWMSVCCLFGPLEIFADCIPCIGPYLGDMVQAVVCVISCPPACACSLFVIGIVWVGMRPMVGIPMLLVWICVVGAFGGWVYYSIKNKKEGGNSDEEDPVPMGLVVGAVPMGQVVGAVVGAPQQFMGPPVDPGVANRFLQALQAEYLNGSDCAVGDFFDSGVSRDDADALASFEDRVRNSGNRAGEINNIRGEWNLWK